MSIPTAEATETRTAVCPRCEGAGEICSGASTFDMEQEQWYPAQDNYVCDVCEGESKVRRTFCLICTEPTDTCNCTDAQIKTFLVSSYLGAA